MTDNSTLAAATNPTTSTPQKPLTYKKRFEGIQATPELLALVDRAVELAKEADASSEPQSDAAVVGAQQTLLDHCNAMAQPHDKENAAPSNQSNNNAQSQTKPLAPPKKQQTPTTTPAVPISILQAAWVVLEQSESSKDKGAGLALDKAIRSSSLAFTPPPPPEVDDENDNAQTAKERQQFQARLERLRLKQEETRYNRLTQNVMDAKALQADDITAKSMTYAASIGLNMIVAPLSFGCFMYFFSGNLLGWISGDNNDNHHRHNHVDIRRVIVSVVSGVLMLFIEMILFVIRTHEVDKAMRGKQKKQSYKSHAFGHYTAKTERRYKDQ